jgi:hypothetical protein
MGSQEKAKNLARSQCRLGAERIAFTVLRTGKIGRDYFEHQFRQSDKQPSRWRRSGDFRVGRPCPAMSMGQVLQLSDDRLMEKGSAHPLTGIPNFLGHRAPAQRLVCC